MDINVDKLKGKWHEMKGEIKKQWDQLTDDDLEKIKGNFDELSEILQKRYGKTKEEIRDSVKSFSEKFSTNKPDSGSVN